MAPFIICPKSRGFWMWKFDRRAFLKYAATGAALTGTSGPAEAGTFFWKRLFSSPARETPFITPNKDFYLVQYDIVPVIKVGRWKLEISGSVKNPMTLDYADFLIRRSIKEMVTLECIDALPGGGYISNAVWEGIPLKELLEEAGIESSAVDVAFHAEDGYSDSITVDRIMKGDVFLAHTMNGVALSANHGYPLRVIVPGLFGIKNVKWITSIEVLDNDYQGYWQQRGWTDIGRIPIMSRIDSPGRVSTSYT